MSGDPVTLKIARPEPRPEVVEKLEMLLAEAKDGSIRQFFYVVDYATQYRTGQVGKGDKMQLIGEVVFGVVGAVLEMHDTAAPTK